MNFGAKRKSREQSETGMNYELNLQPTTCNL